jgi:hypothetical protein
MLRQTTLQLKIITLLIISVSTNAWAQQPGIPLSKQYEDVVAKAGSYQGFKENKLEFLWKSMSDSLQKERQLLKEAQAKLLKNRQTANQSKAGLATAQLELEKSEARVNQVSFLGIPLEKGTYNLVMWGIVLFLGAGLAFAIYRSGASMREARYNTGLYNDLTEEFQKHKVNSNEKEKKLARELQTERNRITELTGHIR